MLMAINSKLFVLLVGLLTVLAGYAAEEHHALTVLERAADAQNRREAELEREREAFQKQLRKYAGQDNSWQDGAKAMQGFKLP